LLSLSRKNLPGVPSRDLNSGLPYSRPARYQLSYAAPYTVTRRKLKFPYIQMMTPSKEKIAVLYFESISYFLRKG
jgi:hypothetical protein